MHKFVIESVSLRIEFHSSRILMGSANKKKSFFRSWKHIALVVSQFLLIVQVLQRPLEKEGATILLLL
jgi:hypothetical protein